MCRESVLNSVIWDMFYVVWRVVKKQTKELLFYLKESEEENTQSCWIGDDIIVMVSEQRIQSLNNTISFFAVKPGISNEGNKRCYHKLIGGHIRLVTKAPTAYWQVSV